MYVHKRTQNIRAHRHMHINRLACMHMDIHRGTHAHTLLNSDRMRSCGANMNSPALNPVADRWYRMEVVCDTGTLTTRSKRLLPSLSSPTRPSQWALKSQEMQDKIDGMLQKLRRVAEKIPKMPGKTSQVH